MRLCICQIIKDEQDYIEEWIEYHHNLGFNKFYLIEDFNSSSHAELLAKYDYVELYRLLDLVNDEEKRLLEENYYRQRIVYMIFERLWKSENDWLAFIDVDEFIDITKDRLEFILENSQEISNIAMQWKNMESEGRIYHPNHGHKYSVVNTYKNFNFNISCHKQIINCNPKFNNNTSEKAWTWCPHYFENNYFEYNIYLKHFLCKSFEEFYNRMTKRKDICKRNIRKIDDWFKTNPRMVQRKQEILNKFNIRNDFKPIYNAYKIE